MSAAISAAVEALAGHVERVTYHNCPASGFRLAHWRRDMSRKIGPLVPPTLLRTERLVLRAAVRKDADEMFMKYTGDPVASHYLQRFAHRDSSQTENVLATWGLENWLTGSRFAWSIRRQTQEDAIGLFFLILSGSLAEIHFGIARAFWGDGLASEAGQAVMGWIVSTQKIEQVSTVCDCEHTASMRVLEKIGLQKVRHLPQHLFLPSMQGHSVLITGFQERAADRS